VAAINTPPTSGLSRQVLRLQVVTIIWMSIEGGVALVTSWEAHSPALLTFGGDSLIELLSAAVVLWRFCFNSRYALTEKRAAQIAGGLLFVLVGIVVLASVFALLGFQEPKPTFFGMALLLGGGFRDAVVSEAKTALGGSN
jgi:hypothetical protein